MTTQKQGFADAGMLTTGVQQLDEALRQPGATPREVIAAKFGRLYVLVAALPLTTDEYCFAINWIAGAHECWTAGDLGAARYQLEMVRKKLASDTARAPVVPLSHLTSLGPSLCPSQTRPFAGASS
jgi:hypothetical protein